MISISMIDDDFYSTCARVERNDFIRDDLEQINVADRWFGPGTPMGKTVFGCLVAT